MVRNDGFFLSRWVQYYGSHLGKENLYILFDGTDQQVPSFASGCNTELVPRVAGRVSDADKGRIALLSSKAAELFGRYDLVIGTDADEFLAVDPALNVGLAEFLSGLDTKGRSSFSGLGCDVVQNVSCEAPLDPGRGMLEQRSHIVLSTRYTKASVLCRPVAWGSGFHRTRKGNYHIVDGLYLFHFGCANMAGLEQKAQDSDLSARGWGRHLGKRMALIRSVASLPLCDWDVWTKRARRLQTWIRPPYAWNKPAMLNLKIVVKLPEKFKNIV